MVKESTYNAGDAGDKGLIPRLGKSPGGGHGNPVQYSSCENPVDRGDWQATIHGVIKSQTQLKQLSMHCPLLAPFLKPGVGMMHKMRMVRLRLDAEGWPPSTLYPSGLISLDVVDYIGASHIVLFLCQWKS